MKTLPDEPIRPGDELLVHWSGSRGNPAEPSVWNVDANGNIQVPTLGPWTAAGKKPSELSNELSKKLSGFNYIGVYIEKVQMQKE